VNFSKNCQSWLCVFSPKVNELFSIVAGIRPNFHNYQIRSLLGKKHMANFNHFLKNPLCEVIRPENDFVQRTLRGRRSLQAPPIGQKLSISLEIHWIYNISLGYAFQLNTVFFMEHTIGAVMGSLNWIFVNYRETKVFLHSNEIFRIAFKGCWPNFGARLKSTSEFYTKMYINESKSDYCEV
jgi:hypothetical protein